MEVVNMNDLDISCQFGWDSHVDFSQFNLTHFLYYREPVWPWTVVEQLRSYTAGDLLPPESRPSCVSLCEPAKEHGLCVIQDCSSFNFLNHLFFLYFMTYFIFCWLFIKDVLDADVTVCQTKPYLSWEPEMHINNGFCLCRWGRRVYYWGMGLYIS